MAAQVTPEESLTLDEEQMLDEEFRELVAAMENYLKPVMAAVDVTIR